MLEEHILLLSLRSYINLDIGDQSVNPVWRYFDLLYVFLCDGGGTR